MDNTTLTVVVVAVVVVAAAVMLLLTRRRRTSVLRERSFSSYSRAFSIAIAAWSANASIAGRSAESNFPSSKR